MGKLKAALFEKEKTKKSDHRILFPGGEGRDLTAPEVIAQKRAIEDAKEHEQEERPTKKAKREAKKAEKARIEVEWKSKDLPKKPKRPLKPKPKDSDNEEEEDSDANDRGGN
ncbi:hypothetical protein K438DRAFT_1780452 [Mycena galopus ATCC 62051]|nr:hypothetical protein K438DRAFT_1780452 [Mycena galopus ATCC 62051]